MLMKIDLNVAVRCQIPILLDKLLTTPAFITNSPSIQLIKVLCRQFDEIVQHTFYNTEPPKPYPTLICIDFHPILSATSLDDALALLIGMHTILKKNINIHCEHQQQIPSTSSNSLSKSLTTFSGESHSQLQSQSKLQITPHDYLFVLGSLTTNQTEEESTDGDDISNSNMPVNTD
ncbi:unnamed protein product, partial [Rotaria sordida]